MAAPVISKSYAAYGANPVAIPYMELYSSLQLKMVDGQVNPLYAVDGMKFYEVQKYMTLSFPDCFFATLCANRAYWESLPKDIQQLVAEAAAGANKYILNEKQAEIADNALQHITAQGTTVHKLTEEERAVFAEIAKRNRNVYTDLVGSTGQQLLDLLVADAQRIK
jgi:TRAP-type C4-dicarboxylate transport system substrate-binding protein